jgi:hypothetical protein
VEELGMKIFSLSPPLWKELKILYLLAHYVILKKGTKMNFIVNSKGCKKCLCNAELQRITRIT